MSPRHTGKLTENHATPRTPAAPPTDAQVQSQIVNFLWAIAELLRDAFKKSENQNVILPFTVLRRLDYALEPARKKVLELNEKLIANPGGLTNHQMGTVFEQLIRRFNEAINENPGEHFTPRDVIHLLVSPTRIGWSSNASKTS